MLAKADQTEIRINGYPGAKKIHFFLYQNLFYLENCVKIGKVLESCSVELNHFGKISRFLSFSTLLYKLLPTLLKLRIVRSS